MTDTLTTEPAAYAHLAMLALRYSPKPMPWNYPHATTEDLEATAALWVRAMCKYPVETVATAVERTCIDRPEWSPNLNEFDRILHDAHKAARQAQARDRGLAVPPQRRCDGGGWIPAPADPSTMVPCRWCSPWLHAEWENGRLGDHGPNRDQRRKDWERDNAMGVPCHPAHDPMAMTVPPVEGRTIAVAAYVAACTAEGRTPTAAVQGWLAGVGTPTA